MASELPAHQLMKSCSSTVCMRAPAMRAPNVLQCDAAHDTVMLECAHLLNAHSIVCCSTVALAATTSTAMGPRARPGRRATGITAPTRATLGTTNMAMEAARMLPTASLPALANSTERHARVPHQAWSTTFPKDAAKWSALPRRGAGGPHSPCRLMNMGLGCRCGVVAWLRIQCIVLSLGMVAGL